MAIAMNNPEKALEHFRAKLCFTISPVDLERELKEDPDACVVVDVRAPADFEEAHVPGSINLPKERWGTLEGLQKQKPNVLLCYSQTCHLAARAAVEFSISGFSVVEMEGGFATWRDHSLPLEHGGPGPETTAKRPAATSGRAVRDVMSPHPIRLPSWAQVAEAARKMNDAHVGSIVVEDDGKLCGIVTDRDVTIRAVAQGLNPATTTLAEICTTEVVTLAPDDDVQHAIDVMRDRAVRRLLVVDGQRAVGILSLGDLAREQDEHSVLGQISGAPPTD